MSCHATLKSVIINLLFVFFREVFDVLSEMFLPFYMHAISSVSEKSYISLYQMSQISGLDTHPAEPSKATIG